MQKDNISKKVSLTSTQNINENSLNSKLSLQKIDKRILFSNLNIFPSSSELNSIIENRFLNTISPKRISEIEKKRGEYYFNLFDDYKKILPKYFTEEGVYGYISDLTKAKQIIFELYFKDLEENLKNYNIRNISPFLDNAKYPIFVAIPKKFPLTEFGIVKGEKIRRNKINLKMKDEVAKKFKSHFSEYVLIIADEFIPINEQIYEPEILLSRKEIEEIFTQRFDTEKELIETILFSLVSSPQVAIKGGNAVSFIIPNKMKGIIKANTIEKLNYDLTEILPSNMVYPLRKINFSDLHREEEMTLKKIKFTNLFEEEREILPSNFVLMKDSGIRFLRFLQTRNLEKYPELQNVIEVSPLTSLTNYKLEIGDKYVNYSEGFFIPDEKSELKINEKSKEIFKMKEVIVNSIRFYQSKIRVFDDYLKKYEYQFLKMRNRIIDEFELNYLLKGRFLASDSNIDGRFGFTIKYGLSDARFRGKEICDEEDIKYAIGLQENFIRDYIQQFSFEKLKEFDKDLEESANKSKTLNEILKIISDISTTNINKEFSFIDIINEGTKNYGIKLEKVLSALDELERRGDIRKVKEGVYKMTEV